MSILEANPSITHTFGNVSCIAMDYIKGYFPQNFFQTEHVSTKMAHRQLNVFRSKKEFWKNKKPMLIMRPRIDLNDSSTFLYGSALRTRMTNNRYDVEFANTVPLVEDKEHGNMVRFGWTRSRITFDVVVVVETYNQQINIAHSLMNLMVPNTPYIIKHPLEAYIPKTIITPLAEHIGAVHDVEEQIGSAVVRKNEVSTSDVLAYLNTQSCAPITYKYKNGSGNNEFFMLYDTNIETIISDIDRDDGDTKEMVQNTFTLSFQLSMEFFTVANWYLFLKNGDPNFMTAPPDVEMGDGDRMIPIYSIPLRYNLNLEPGWKIYTAPMCFVSDKYMSQGYDDTDLSEVITDSIKKVIRHQLGMHIPVETMIRFRCFKDNEELPYGVNGFQVDLETFILKIFDCNHQSTYRLFILTNNFLINSMASEITNFNQEL